MYTCILKGEEPPVYIPCDELLTTEHVLLILILLNKGILFYSSVTDSFIGGNIFGLYYFNICKRPTFLEDFKFVITFWI